MSDVFQVGDLVTINSQAFVVEVIEVGVRNFDYLQTNISLKKEVNNNLYLLPISIC
jgi:hypothetical protein